MTTFIFHVGGADHDLYSLRNDTAQADNNIPLDRAIELAEQDPIWAQRGKAIQGYAQLENSLCSLFASIGNIQLPAASTIFYKIVNTGSRTSILEKLMRQKHGTQFNPFWNVFFRELKMIDSRRSEIAHWMAVANVALDLEHKLLVGVMLIPPTGSMTYNENSPNLKLNDLADFQTKCEAFSRLVNMFTLATNPAQQLDDDKRATWLDIFQQPLIYPLPEDHPLNKKTKEPDSPPQSSQA
jgi:hypothetical protein